MFKKITAETNVAYKPTQLQLVNTGSPFHFSITSHGQLPGPIHVCPEVYVSLKQWKVRIKCYYVCNCHFFIDREEGTHWNNGVCLTPTFTAANAKWSTQRIPLRCRTVTATDTDHKTEPNPNMLPPNANWNSLKSLACSERHWVGKSTFIIKIDLRKGKGLSIKYLGKIK